MPTFLRSFVACLVALLLLPAALTARTGAEAASHQGSLSPRTPPARPSLSTPDKKRLLMLRRSETPDGARFTLTSDTPLDDYKSFAEGERICVMIPQAAFVQTRGDASERGFADMRIEQRDDDIMLSFRLQQGATVAVNQHFNRLDVIFITNEQANSAR